MSEYIEREPILKFIEDGLNNPDKLKAFGHDAIEIMTEVQYAPAADVAPVVHGRWKNITIAVVDTTGYCGVCGEQAVWRSRNKPYAICPNCGAKMDGEVNGNA